MKEDKNTSQNPEETISDERAYERYLLGEERLSAAAYDQAELTGDGLVNGFDLASLKQQLFR